MHRYNRCELIGVGQFAKVYCATIVRPNHIARERVAHVALKVVKINTDKDKAKVNNEIAILRCLGKHPHIVYMMDAILPNTIVLEYCAHGTLEDFVNTPQSLPTLWHAIRQFHSILGYLSYHEIVHLDIKPANLLLSAPPPALVIKLTDFGLATRRNDIITNWCGTPYYMSPERIIQKYEATYALDMWSVGVVLFMLCTGTRPFNAPTLVKFCELLRCNPVPPAIRRDDLPPVVSHLVCAMLHRSPVLRLTCGQFGCHAAMAEANAFVAEAKRQARDSHALEQELFAAMQPDTLALAAYRHTSVAASVPELSWSFRLNEQLGDVAQSLQLFASASGRADKSLDATVDTANEYESVCITANWMWRLLSIVRSFCLLAPPLVRQSVAAFVLHLISHRVGQLQCIIDKWVDRDRISRQLVWAVRNADRLLYFLSLCNQQWAIAGKPAPPAHPAAYLAHYAMVLALQSPSNSHTQTLQLNARTLAEALVMHESALKPVLAEALSFHK